MHVEELEQDNSGLASQKTELINKQPYNKLCSEKKDSNHNDSVSVYKKIKVTEKMHDDNENTFITPNANVVEEEIINSSSVVTKEILNHQFLQQFIDNSEKNEVKLNFFKKSIC